MAAKIYQIVFLFFLTGSVGLGAEITPKVNVSGGASVVNLPVTGETLIFARAAFDAQGAQKSWLVGIDYIRNLWTAASAGELTFTDVFAGYNFYSVPNSPLMRFGLCFDYQIAAFSFGQIPMFGGGAILSGAWEGADLIWQAKVMSYAKSNDSNFDIRNTFRVDLSALWPMTGVWYFRLGFDYYNIGYRRSNTTGAHTELTLSALSFSLQASY